MITEAPEFGFASLVVVTLGLVELVKYIDSQGKLNRFYPLFSEAIGFILGYFGGMGWFSALTIGLVASGLYRGVKVVRGE